MPERRRASRLRCAPTIDACSPRRRCRCTCTCPGACANARTATSIRTRRSGALPFDAYVDALLADLDFDLPLAWGRTVHSVFFGGGTPILFPPEAIDRVPAAGQRAAALRAGRARSPSRPIPAPSNTAASTAIAPPGVNRLSFGIQSFDDGCLQRLGRIHDSGEAERAVKLGAGRRLRQPQPRPDVRAAAADAGDGDATTSNAPSRCSPRTSRTTSSRWSRTRCSPRGRRPASPTTIPPGTCRSACQALLAEAGFAQYEISAYARAGRQCAHNLNYWRFGDYLGIGAGAHGKLTLGATPADPAALEAQAPRRLPGHGRHRRGDRWRRVHRAAQRLPFDFMLNALRLNDGVPMAMFEARTGLPAAAIADRVALAHSRGWLEPDAGLAAPDRAGAPLRQRRDRAVPGLSRQNLHGRAHALGRRD